MFVSIRDERGSLMLKSFDLDIIKRAVKIFVVATICLVITTIFCYFVHPSFNELKNMGMRVKKLATLKDLKKFGSISLITVSEFRYKCLS